MPVVSREGSHCKHGNRKTYSATPDELAFLVEDHGRCPVAAIASRLVQIVVRLDKPVARTDPGAIEGGDVPRWGL